MEYKSIKFELKDIDKGSRVAVIAHAAYDNIDRTQDVSRKGMFTKSWNESKGDINFYLNHNDEQAPGKVTDVFDDGQFAYTKAWLGTHTLGNDTLIMMDEGVIKNASFGYIVEKKNYIRVKDQSVRELKEVKHLETSVLTKIPANPMAGVRQVVKSFMGRPEVKALSQPEQDALKQILLGDQGNLELLVALSSTLEPTSDLYTWINWNIGNRSSMIGDIRAQLKYNINEVTTMKSHVQLMENFCRNTKASDDCIKSILLDIENTKQLISDYDTAFTQAGGEPLEPNASENEKKLLDVLETFNKQLKNVGTNGNKGIRTEAWRD